ncbi:MAG: nitroreductase [Alphaproteobacteria bacterium]
MHVDEAITSRRSVRAFLPTPVDEAVIRHILEVAARAPSGSNTQPWKVYVVTGTAKERLSAAILKARREDSPDAHQAEYHYYLRKWREPYHSRRRKIGWGLYGLVGIKKGDVEASQRQHDRNFVFFDAPVGLIVTLERDMEKGSWIDLGMFLENVMLSARAQGLHTCAQAAFMNYHTVIRRELGIPEDEIVVCGMSIGREDTTKPENQLRTEREPVDRFARFFGF